MIEEKGFPTHNQLLYINVARIKELDPSEEIDFYLSDFEDMHIWLLRRNDTLSVKIVSKKLAYLKKEVVQNHIKENHEGIVKIATGDDSITLTLSIDQDAAVFVELISKVQQYIYRKEFLNSFPLYANLTNSSLILENSDAEAGSLKIIKAFKPHSTRFAELYTYFAQV